MLESSPTPSIESVKRNEYNHRAEMYELLITGEKQEHQYSYYPELLQALKYVPMADKLRIEDFTTRVVSVIPENVLTSYQFAPTSREGLRALVAHAYRVDESAHQDHNLREMYIRAMSSLSGDSIFFVNGNGGSTEEAIEEYFERDFSVESFANMLLQLSTATTPVTAYSEEMMSERTEGFAIFLEKLRGRYREAMKVMLGYVSQHYPDKAEHVSQWTNNLVFVEQISRLKLFTNDEELNEVGSYNGLSAGAVAFGVDQITGLPLTVTRRPYNYDQVAKNPELTPKEDPTFHETITLIHENIHNVEPDREVKGDFLHLINELLTDAAAWVIALKAEQQEFANCGNEYMAFTGYFDLVLFAQNLVRNGLIREDEIVQYGLQQDPTGFLRLLSERVQQCDDSTKIHGALTVLEKRMLIRPRKLYEQEELAEAFRTNCAGFLESELMEMWQLVGGQYLGHKAFLLSTFDFFRERHPEIEESDFRAVRNEDGTLIDEAVDIFYEVVKPQKRYRSVLLSREQLEDLVSQNEPWAAFHGLRVPDSLAITEEEIPFIYELIEVTNQLFYLGLSFRASSQWSEQQKLAVIIASSLELYQGAVEVFEKNWRSKNIAYGKEEILTILNEVVAKWLHWKDQSDQASAVVTKILEGLDAMTQGVGAETDEIAFGPEQLLFWGPALELHSSK